MADENISFKMERVVLDGHIHHIKLTDRLNVISASFVKRLNHLLDEVEATSGPAAVVLSSSNPLIFSAGLDLKALMNGTDEERAKYINDFIALTRRLLCFPVPTLCLMDGKCIAGGVFLSMGFDYRVAVDSAHTYFHLNELDNGFGLPVPLINLIANRTGSNQLLTQMASFALKTSVQDGLRYGLVQAVFPDRNLAMAHVLERARLFAPKAVHRHVMSSIKESVNAPGLVPKL